MKDSRITAKIKFTKKKEPRKMRVEKNKAAMKAIELSIML